MQSAPPREQIPALEAEIPVERGPGEATAVPPVPEIGEAGECVGPTSPASARGGMVMKSTLRPVESRLGGWSADLQQIMRNWQCRWFRPVRKQTNAVGINPPVLGGVVRR